MRTLHLEYGFRGRNLKCFKDFEIGLFVAPNADFRELHAFGRFVAASGKDSA